ncbi:MAG: glutaredoxin family protein [Candidatus Omnitrophica bacterium]|nr:glutaredoxin family protein [Candidatus Omnitrophota bacterium]
MKKKVIFYDGGCADCQKVSAFFSANGVDYERKNIKAHPELAEEAKQKGAKQFPAVFIGNDIVEGWNESALKQKIQ